MKALVSLLALSAIFFASSGWAYEHPLIRRVSVFPLKAPAEYRASAEEAWWQEREALSESQRFLIASKNFLIQKDVFQARAELSAADVVILAKLLDAQALITSFLFERTLSLRVYEGEYGRLLWSKDVQLHGSLPISDQLGKAAKKLINDFVASIPYHGFVTVDPEQGKPFWQEEKKTHMRIDLGKGAEVQVGDKVQVIRIQHDSVQPLFAPETPVEIVAEGVVVKLEDNGATVEILRAQKPLPIKEFGLIRLPGELKRVRDAMGLSESIKKIDTDYFAPEVTPLKQKLAERKPLVAALTFIGNLAVFLLLAF